MTDYPTPRHAEWGHWSITFWQRDADTPRGHPGTMVAEVAFPVGTRGPMDAMPGQRERYRELIRAWVEDGIAP